MKTLSALFAAATLIASTHALADVFRNDVSPFSVKVPNIRSGFEMNVEGLFLRPTHSDLQYGVVDSVVSGDAQQRLLSVKPEAELAWGVGVGYVFPDSGNDVQLNWVGFSHTASSAFVYTEQSLPLGSGTTLYTLSGNFINMNDPDLDFGPGLDVTTALGHARFELNAVDLDAGQYVDVGTRLQLRTFSGLRYARLENNLKVVVDVNDVTRASSLIQTERDSLKSKFTGLGPLLGAEANYNLGGGVHAAAHVATALLVGKLYEDSSFVSELLGRGHVQSVVARVGSSVVGVGGGEKMATTIGADEVWRVVPAFDAKLGLNYSYAFDCDSVATLEGGYKVSQYLDVADKKAFDNSNDIPIHVTSSIGFAGPYAKLSFKF